MKTVFIYALNDPTSGRTRYIGKSKKPRDRFSKHLNRSRRETNHRANWINSLRNIGQEPVLEILDEVPEVEWEFWEREWIQLYRVLGFDLVNSTEGGIGWINPSPKMKEIARDTENPRFTGKHHTEKSREKIRVANTGHEVSEEAREKIRRARLGKPSSNKGKRHSEETRKKISLALAGLPRGKHSDETRAKQSAAHKGKPKSEAHKAALRRGWAERRERLANAS